MSNPYPYKGIGERPPVPPAIKRQPEPRPERESDGTVFMACLALHIMRASLARR